jgi:hypothetical protein
MPEWVVRWNWVAVMRGIVTRAYPLVHYEEE